MKEYDIRPVDLFNQYLNLSATDVAEYFSNSGEWVERNCPGCDGMSFESAFKKNGFNFVNCSYCNTLFVTPCPGDAQFKRFYQESPSQKFWTNSFFPAVQEIRRQKIFRPRATKIKSILKHRISDILTVIDVGAGSGVMLDEIRIAGIGQEHVAIEPTPDSITMCKKRDWVHLRVLQARLRVIEACRVLLI